MIHAKACQIHRKDCFDLFGQAKKMISGSVGPLPQQAWARTRKRQELSAQPHSDKVDSYTDKKKLHKKSVSPAVALAIRVFQWACEVRIGVLI